MTDSATPLEQKLGYAFGNRALLQEALRHSSFVNEQPDAALRDNERLEFLGDAVLNLVIGHMLMESHPHLDEGNLSRMRATLVNESRLARISRSLDIGGVLCLGKGEIQTNGRQKKSILADALEAILAAVYLDGGFQAAFGLVNRLFAAHVASIAGKRTDQDYKSRLQEQVQTTGNAMPCYQIIGESGPDHDKTFDVQLQVGETVTEGSGKSKKAAEQDAARKALGILAGNRTEA